MTICVLRSLIDIWLVITQIGNEGQSEEALNLRQAAHKKLVRWFEEYAFQDGQRHCI